MPPQRKDTASFESISTLTITNILNIVINNTIYQNSLNNHHKYRL